jgi:protein-tyrosine phosphatase
MGENLIVGNMKPHMCEVIPRLFLGDEYASKKKEWLDKVGITHIVNAAEEIENYFPDNFKYFNANLKDSSTELLLDKAGCGVLFIELALRDPGNKVYVHCHLGKSRSVSIIIYYLMSKYKIPYEHAFYLTRSKRAISEPNTGYEMQLRYHADDLE